MSNIVEMDKLIELLREFDDENWNAVHIENYIYAQDYMIISKRFGFIKRLVDNDKIDREWLEFSFYIRSRNKITHSDYVSKEEILLMILSIQDEPIEFLINILK